MFGAFWIGWAGLWLSATLHAQERSFSFPLPENDYQRYLGYTAGRDPLDLDRLPRQGLNRHLMELLVFQNALVLGGCRCQIRFQPYATQTTNARTLIDLQQGRLLASPVAGFRSDSRVVGDVHVSDAVLEDDAFKVGVYTHVSRADVLAIRDPAAVRQLTFVVVESWEVDLRVLTERKLRHVKAVNWSSALRMLEAGRADAILQPFSNRADMSFDEPSLGLQFKPIPGMKMNFGHGRYYFVSRHHPDGEWFVERLNAGLRRLKADGRLQALRVASGVEDARLKDFVEIP